VSGNGAYEGEMNEIATFESALRAAVPTRPDPALGRALVPRLAQAARASTLEAEGRAARRRPRSRIASVARVGIAVALIPLVLAGLAFAGVTVPGPARSAFDSVGIKLPNQPSHKSPASTSGGGTATTTGNDVSAAAKSPAHHRRGGNSAAAHRHALAQHAKAHGRARGHGHGRAVGLTGSTPPGQSGATGSHGNSSGGGSSSSHPAHPAAPVHPTHPVHPVHPTHPIHPTHPSGSSGGHGNGK
jgi:hypothetical protein